MADMLDASAACVVAAMFVRIGYALGYGKGRRDLRIRKSGPTTISGRWNGGESVQVYMGHSSDDGMTLELSAEFDPDEIYRMTTKLNMMAASAEQQRRRNGMWVNREDGGNG